MPWLAAATGWHPSAAPASTAARYSDADGLTIPELEALTAKAKSLRNTLLGQSELQIKAVVRSIVDRMTLEPGKLTVAINCKNLAVAFGVQSMETDASIAPHLRVVPYSLKRRGVEAKL